jgi:hypothetical protein
MIKYLYLLLLTSCATQYIPIEPLKTPKVHIQKCPDLVIPTKNNWLSVIVYNSKLYYICQSQVDAILKSEESK